MVAALDQRSTTNGSWKLKFTSKNGAPPQLGVADVTNLVDKIIYVATLGTTNIVGGVTNLVGCTTNIIGAVTNIFVGAVLWAPVPPLVANPSKESFKRRELLELPVLAPSPRSHGLIKVQYVGGRGQSVLDMRAMALPRGQTYTVWMEDGSSYTNIGPLALSGANGRFIRDTGKGQPLPLQAQQIGGLSGRGVLITNGLGEIVLEGVIP